MIVILNLIQWVKASRSVKLTLGCVSGGVSRDDQHACQQTERERPIPIKGGNKKQTCSLDEAKGKEGEGWHLCKGPFCLSGGVFCCCCLPSDSSFSLSVWTYTSSSLGSAQAFGLITLLPPSSILYCDSQPLGLRSYRAGWTQWTHGRWPLCLSTFHPLSVAEKFPGITITCIPLENTNQYPRETCSHDAV